MQVMENTINQMAEWAAESAVEAFGKDQPAKARDAYDFVCQVQYESETEPEFPQLTSQQFRAFRHDYCRWLRNHGVALDVATEAAFR